MIASLKHQMNKWGPDGCERRIKRILAKMRANAEENGVAFIAFAAAGTWQLGVNVDFHEAVLWDSTSSES